MRIIHKVKWGFWFFKRYSFYVEDKGEGITEVFVDKKTWENYGIGDYRDSVYGWFYSYKHNEHKIQN